MISDPVLVLPDDVAASIESRSSRWGVIDLAGSSRERALLVTGHSHETDSGDTSRWTDRHRWRSELSLWERAGEAAGQGLYYRVQPDLNQLHFEAARRDGALDLAHFRSEITDWREPGSGAIVLTLAPEADVAGRWRAWFVAGGQVRPLFVARQLRELDALAPLSGLWPLERLRGQRVAVVGVGSIGSAVSESLLGYGVREMTLVDYDHLLFHNFARHRLTDRDLGRLKIEAMADHLRMRDGQAQIRTADLDILTDTDRLRPLFLESAAVVVATDGVASRRVANHIACWAGRPAVFVCEMRNQGVGEIVRYRPGATGCLWCLREDLIERGSFDPEPDLDRGYGTGEAHRPTTAVGSDLWLLGDMAAKLTVATLLEREGVTDQRTNEDHVTVGLRPLPGLPPPFDVRRAGEVKWNRSSKPREGCPSCGATAMQLTIR